MFRPQRMQLLRLLRGTFPHLSEDKADTGRVQAREFLDLLSPRMSPLLLPHSYRITSASTSEEVPHSDRMLYIPRVRRSALPIYDRVACSQSGIQGSPCESQLGSKSSIGRLHWLLRSTRLHERASVHFTALRLSRNSTRPTSNRAVRCKNHESDPTLQLTKLVWNQELNIGRRVGNCCEL